MELKKTLEIANDKAFTTMLRLQFKEGGNVPEKYSGMYKSRAKAKQAIVEYERELAEKKYYPSAPNTAEENSKPRVTKTVEADAPLVVEPFGKAEVVDREPPKAAPKKKAAPTPKTKKEEVTNDGEAKDIS